MQLPIMIFNYNTTHAMQPTLRMIVTGEVKTSFSIGKHQNWIDIWPLELNDMVKHAKACSISVLKF